MKPGRRVVIAAGLLACGIFLLHAASRQPRRETRLPLREFPSVIGSWSGTDEAVEDEILKILRADDHVQRVYTRPDGAAVEFFVAYYADQHVAKRIHKPTVCLPASGWTPVRAGRISVELAGRPAMVNEYVVEKDGARQIVLYWYQCGGRAVASEYRARFWMVANAITRNRSDGALVRTVARVDHGEPEARARAVEFVRAMTPRLHEFIPD